MLATVLPQDIPKPTCTSATTLIIAAFSVSVSKPND